MTLHRAASNAAKRRGLLRRLKLLRRAWREAERAAFGRDGRMRTALDIPAVICGSRRYASLVRSRLDDLTRYWTASG
jgi:hypothetical protein